MVIKSIFTGAHQPVRSVSLPTRVELKPEPLLQSLKSFQVSSCNAKTTPFGLEEIQAALVGLAELYNSVGELVQSSSTQQALVHYKEGKLVEEALNESVVLIDSCSSARDIILTMKQNIQTLQSALRRKCANSIVENHVRAYFSFRRKAKKDIGNYISVLKRMENDRTTNFFLLWDIQNHDLLPLIKLLREARSVSISIFGELLAFLSAPVVKGNARGWSLVSQLMPVIKSGSGKGQKTVNELENVDIALNSLLGQGRGTCGNDNKAEVQIAQRRIGTLASSFEGIESGLDCMFRCLVKHRVCFLNMLVH
ncbi:uncharacterized protein LOC101217557 [Cucumis sativus]|uniref:Uncharacterized protein n=1 Tax=Cucumis sativus TaxID=3659 RepID=A0A0A0KMP4_CUCSA|nr:uncharacterized protein LOC101217557 [Cucumis sativus]KGN48976.1 hypothetical protein Csa_003327 [Cucumis sativus]